MPYLIKSAGVAKQRSHPNQPVTLLVSLVGQGFGGLETHLLSLYKQLAARGQNPILLVAANSSFHRRIQHEQLNFYAARGAALRGFRHLIPFIFSKLCKHHDIRVIHCNNRFEVPGALLAGRKFSSKVVFNYHVPVPFDTSILRGLDAFIAPSPAVVRYIDEQNRTRNLGIRCTRAIPPLFDAEKFLTYRSSAEPASWFASTFGIALKPSPIICTIGNMVPDLEHKNYPLLFESIATLVHQGKPLQAVLVGDGPARPYLEQVARDRGISDCVHFLGQNSEHVPGVLHHSDVFVLASKHEAFGIVYLEAGLMKKPAIGARQTGAEVMIVDQQTGLLFENGDARDLAAAIERLIGAPDLAKQMGAQAFEHISQQFLPSVVIEQYEAVYTA